MVHSDTFGAIRNRAGKVLLTKITLRHSAVFALLARWIEDNAPEKFGQLFPFTSVNINFGYAARVHRDGNNIGPSMTKSLGSFTGGNLLYWENDDGRLDLSTADPAHASCTFDTRRQMVLFDGNRAHAVSPFKGERYSLVFFTCPGYLSLSTAQKEVLVHIGSVWPDAASTAFWVSLLGPPTGDCKNIRRMFGYDEKPGAIQFGGTSLIKLESMLAIVLSFAIGPLNVPHFCACSKDVNAAALSPDAWEDVLVRSKNLRPVGAKARVHFKLWKKAHVIHGPWSYANVEIMLSNIRMWRFQHTCHHFGGVSVSISSPLVEPNVSFHYDSIEALWLGFSSTKNIKKIVCEYHRGKPRACTPFMCGVGMGHKRGGVGRVDITATNFAVTAELASSKSLVVSPGRPCYFVVIGEHALQPIWDFP